MFALVNVVQAQVVYLVNLLKRCISSGTATFNFECRTLRFREIYQEVRLVVNVSIYYVVVVYLIPSCKARFRPVLFPQDQICTELKFTSKC
jgi:hypothetical protein